MSLPLLVLRPEPGNAATVAAARAVGMDTIAAPLFSIKPLEWQLPISLPDAVLMTSANAARCGGPHLQQLTGLPVYAVGAATAEAARDAGFSRINVGNSDVGAVFALALQDHVRTLLHLSGRDFRAPAAPGITIDRRIIYCADPVDTLPGAAAVLPRAIALLHSPRAARLFASLVAPDAIAIAAISDATLVAAGPGWRATAVAAEPTDASLLAVAAKLCDQGC